jgi:hypothetical protein
MRSVGRTDRPCFVSCRTGTFYFALTSAIGWLLEPL